MPEERSIFDALSPKQMFVTGLVGGIMVLCTIGFFILLTIMLSGGSTGKTTRTPGTVVTDASGNVEGPEKFSQCLDSGSTASAVAADLQLGSSIGVGGTPATFVNGVLVSGAFPYDALKQVIEGTLAGKNLVTDPDFAFLQDQETGKVVKVTMPELPNAVWLGNEDAKIEVVEFSDFECPYCLRFEPAIQQMLTEYGDKIKFTYRHYPLSFHPNAQKAAEAFECAKEQGMAWEMHSKLFGLQTAGQLGINGYKRVATELGLD